MKFYDLVIEHIDGVSVEEDIEAEDEESATDYFINNLASNYYQAYVSEVIERGEI